MLTSYEGSVRLNLDMPCPLGAVARQKSKSLTDFSQSQAKTKVVCSQCTMQTTARPFHFLHMGPMSDVDMLCMLWVADFGHDMTSWHCVACQKFGRFQPEPSQNQGCLCPAHQEKHCWTISFPPYGSNEWCYHVGKALCGQFCTCQVCLELLLAKKFGRFQPEPSQNQRCLQSAQQGNHCWTIFSSMCVD